MVDAANLLLGAAVGPEQIQCPGVGQTVNDQGLSDSLFLAIVQNLIGSEEQTSADPMRAGQQTTVDEQSETPDAHEMSCLLGSVQIACSEVQALPSPAVTNASVEADVLPTNTESSTTYVAPIEAQPIPAEQSAEVAADGSPVQVAEIPSDAAGRACIPAAGGEVPAAQAQTVAVSAEVSVQAGQRTNTTTVQPRTQASDTQAAPADVRATAEAPPRERAPSAELPEYLRNIVPQDGSRFASRVIIGREPQDIRPAVDIDPELAMMPVDQPERGDVATDWTGADRPTTWTPIEVRPTAESPIRTVMAPSQSRPIDQVERTNIIHQIVRTAEVHTFDGGGEMVMRLEPAHLGSIHMSVTADQGVVTAHLTVGNESVRQALEGEIVMLRQSLADTGIHVDSISVSVGDSLSQGWNWHAGQHNGSQFAGNQQSGYNAARLFSAQARSTTVEQSSSTYTDAGFNYLA